MVYRNDENAIESRRLEIERELVDVRSRVGQFEYLKWRLKELEGELAALEKSKVSFVSARQLPMLANAKIASPCNADWNAMVGDEHVRFCKSCEKNVYNLSSLTTAAAEALIREKEGNLCARLYRRSDDTVLTADCKIGVRMKWVRRVAGAAVLVGSATAAGVGYRQQQAALQRSLAEKATTIEPVLAQDLSVAMAGAPHTIIPPEIKIEPRRWTAKQEQEARHQRDLSGRHMMGAMIAPTNRNR